MVDLEFKSWSDSRDQSSLTTTTYRLTALEIGLVSLTLLHTQGQGAHMSHVCVLIHLALWSNSMHTQMNVLANCFFPVGILRTHTTGRLFNWPQPEGGSIEVIPLPPFKTNTTICWMWFAYIWLLNLQTILCGNTFPSKDPSMKGTKNCL